MKGQPFSSTNTIENHVGGNLEENDAERQHLLSHVELVLGDVYVFKKIVGQSVGNVASVELWNLSALL